MVDLYEFLYLDTSKLHSFVSQIQGNFINEINEIVRQRSGLSTRLNINIPPIGENFDASKAKESEQKHIVQLNDSAYFNILYHYLEGSNKIRDITNSSLNTRDSLDVGQFIEMRGMAEPPVVEQWVEQVNSIFDFVNRHFKLFSTPHHVGKGRPVPAMANQQLKQFKDMLDFLTDYIYVSRRDPGKQYIRVTAERQPFNIWGGLLTNYISPQLHATLPADVRVFARVERLLDSGEVWKIVDLSKFNQNTQATQLIEALNGFSSVIGQKQISEDDLQAQFPDILVTPIAIYR
jgi:hypothetical protein